MRRSPYHGVEECCRVLKSVEKSVDDGIQCGKDGNTCDNKDDKARREMRYLDLDLALL
jgi:hypothetical protein